MKMKEKVQKIFAEALRSVDPCLIVRAYAEKALSYYLMKNFSKLYVIGFGKASYQMAKSVEEVFDPDMISGGIIVTKYGHAGLRSKEHRTKNTDLKKIQVYEAGHPVPDENGMKATEEIMGLLKNADKDSLVLCLISGGGSALFLSPYEGITLGEKQTVTDLLLKAGADITELNAVRKHISKIKGGRLAEIVYPAEVISLMISDVIGDKLDVIASGPTAPDSSTYRDALDVLEKYNLAGRTPHSVMETLKKGSRGLIPDTPDKDNKIFDNVQNMVIGSNSIAVEAAKKEAGSQGLKTEILSKNLTGEAREVGKRLAERAKEAKIQNKKGTEAYKHRETKCFISGGETTVMVKGEGKGGRNTELALSFAMEVEDVDGMTLLSAGTDGTDGPTDAAGAIVDGNTISKARGLGLDPQLYLDNNDSYHFFKKTDSLLITGPTGTNVMDLQILIVE